MSWLIISPVDKNNNSIKHFHCSTKEEIWIKLHEIRKVLYDQIDALDEVIDVVDKCNCI